MSESGSFKAILVASVLSISGPAAAGGDDNEKPVPWATYVDKALTAPEKLVKINSVNKCMKIVGAPYRFLTNYAPAFMVDDKTRFYSRCYDGLPKYVSVIGETAGSFMPYVHVYKGVRSFGTAVTMNSSDTTEDLLNMVNGYMAYGAVSYPSFVTACGYGISKMACLGYGIYKQKDVIVSNYKFLSKAQGGDVPVDNSENSFLSVQLEKEDDQKISEFLITADLTYALGYLGITDTTDLDDVLVKRSAKKSYLKLKGTWIKGQNGTFFGSHTSLKLESILRQAGLAAVLRSVTEKKGKEGLKKFLNSWQDGLAGIQKELSVNAGNTRFSNTYKIRYLDKRGDNPVYIEDDDEVYYDPQEF